MSEQLSEVGGRVSGYVLSILRTLVPGAWGALVGWLLTNVPWLADALQLDEGDASSVPAWVYVLAMTGWYALWRKLEPHLPAWATRILLGANTAPRYIAPATEASLSVPKTLP